jgi:hypothetical protein
MRDAGTEFTITAWNKAYTRKNRTATGKLKFNEGGFKIGRMQFEMFEMQYLEVIN